MRESIIGAVIGAIITGLFSLLIFHLGNFSTQKSIVESLSVRFDSVDQKMSYEQALEIIYQERENDKKEIESLNTQLSDLNTKIIDQQAKIDQQNSTEEVNKIIKNATEYWNNSDFVQSLTLLKNSKTQSEDIKTLYEQYSNEYVISLLNQADELISERDYNAAVEILKEGTVLVSDNRMLNEKIDTINNKPTALLSNLTPVSGEIKSIWNVREKDNYGNTYTSGICLHQSYNKAAHVVYSLDGKYTTLTGKFVLDEASKNTDGNYVLYAYSLKDGNMSLIYTSPILSTATRPINVEINVSDVMDLVLEVYDPNKDGDNADTGFVDAKLE